MNTPLIKAMLAGAIMLNAWAIAVFFIRFWRKTRDRLFAWFAVGFILLGIERITLISAPTETNFPVYLIRLAAFLLFICGIVDKNRARPTR